MNPTLLFIHAVSKEHSHAAHADSAILLTKSIAVPDDEDVQVSSVCFLATIQPQVRSLEHNVTLMTL